ncbi:MAG TPA: hypothetical protein VMM12_18825 [Longimicrobiales bacterium]|nr:hypothetical protein [Longimicrobiales bacterium]
MKGMATLARVAAVAALVAGLVACGGGELDTRTFELKYMQLHEARALISPYVYGDREGAPGTFEVAGSALTVRETPDNLEKIERMLADFDRPRPLVMLHFQIIRADGAAAPDAAIADVERELRRLFRFEGYALLAETRVGAMEHTGIRQIARGGGQEFVIAGGVGTLSRSENPTVTIEVQLGTEEEPSALRTQVTTPVGHTVVLGTLETRDSGALILVVRAEIAGGEATPLPTAPDTATPG